MRESGSGMNEKKDDNVDDEIKIEPTDNDETNNLLRTLGKGAKWGALIGFVIAAIYIKMNTLPALGFYLGNDLLVNFVCIGLGAGIGALCAWLSTIMPDER